MKTMVSVLAMNPMTVTMVMGEDSLADAHWGSPSAIILRA